MKSKKHYTSPAFKAFSLCSRSHLMQASVEGELPNYTKQTDQDWE